MHRKPPLRPGRIAKRFGQYQQLGPCGGRGKAVTVTRGEPLPRTPNMSYTLVDPTKNKSGRGG